MPNNTTLVFVGGVTLEEIVPRVERWFGQMERRPEPRRVEAVEPVPAAERRVVYRSDEAAPRVEARFLVPGVGHPDRPGADVLGEVAGMMVEEALERAGIEGTVNPNTRVVHEGRFGVPASLNLEVVLESPGDLEPAEQALLATLDELAAAPPDPALLALARKRLRTRWYRTARDASSLAFEIGHFQVMDSWRTLEAFLDARQATTGEDVRRLAARYFVPENRTIGVVRPPAPAPGGATMDPGGDR